MDWPTVSASAVIGAFTGGLVSYVTWMAKYKRVRAHILEDREAERAQKLADDKAKRIREAARPLLMRFNKCVAISDEHSNGADAAINTLGRERTLVATEYEALDALLETHESLRFHELQHAIMGDPTKGREADEIKRAFHKMRDFLQAL